jgi:D-aminoacyl-tRNA deacylase
VKSVIQRVLQARVTADGELLGEIGPGLAVLVCMQPGDDAALAGRYLDKLLKLRVFADDAGRMNRSLAERPGAGLLLVSQFTLAASLSGGNRPSFDGAAAAELARPWFEALVALARERHATVAAGRFGADMQLTLTNDGPVTLLLDMH